MKNGFYLMRGSLIALCSLALSLSWLVFFGAGARQSDWDAALLFVGATALFYWSFRTGQTPPRVPLWFAIALWALPAYVLFQLLPMPPALLAALSPSRSAVTETLGSIIPTLKNAPVAIAPAAAVLGLFSVLACLTVMSLMRDLQWRFAVSRPWLPAIPLILIATFEALIGVIQWLGAPQTLPVRGTLASTEPFAGLLEVALPFTLISGFISFRRHQELQVGSALPAARAVVTWLASLMILLALFHCSSKTSHTVVFTSMFVVLALAIIPRLKTRELRLYGMGGAAVVALVALLLAVSPVDAPASLAQLGTADGDAAETRLNLWNSSASLLGEYRLLGTGMGGFESTFPKYQSSTELTTVQHPHNDVLDMLITFGLGGSCIVLVMMAGILRPAIIGSIFLIDESRRLLAVAITASLLGVMVRSGMESAISLPAVALAAAWVAGMSQGNGLD
jgi:hypothetical protein